MKLKQNFHGGNNDRQHNVFDHLISQKVRSCARFKFFFLGGVAGSEDFAYATLPTTPPLDF